MSTQDALVEGFHRSLLMYGYKISVATVRMAVEKFQKDPNARPYGGPEEFIKAWLEKVDK